jgi:hypothetical protein
MRTALRSHLAFRATTILLLLVLPSLGERMATERRLRSWAAFRRVQRVALGTAEAIAYAYASQGR